MKRYLVFIMDLCFRAARERPVAAFLFIFRGVHDRLRGRMAAKIVGWTNSYLGPRAKVVGTKAIFVAGNAYIQRDAWIEAVFNHCGQSFEPTILIGKNFGASDRLHITCIDRIEIGDNCLFGSGVFIGDHNHGAYEGDAQSSPSSHPVQRTLVSGGPVIIGSNVWLGDNVVVIGPVKIGNGVVVGANSVVTKDIPDNVVVAGTPARILRIFDITSGEWKKNAQ